MLWIYRTLTALLAPLALWRLSRLGQSASPSAQAHAPTRLGRPAPHSTPSPIDVWFHAASVGEINTITPLIEKALDSGHRALVTTFTPTGFDQACARFTDRVWLAYAPLDTKRAVSRWLDYFQPPVLVVAETELWPELFHQCHRRHIDVVLVNARLSDQHFKRYQRFSKLYRHALKAVVRAACQSAAQQKKWTQLGLSAEQAVVTGNLKAAGDWASLTFEDRPHPRGLAWAAGSLHPKEFEWVIEAHGQLLEHHPQATLILAPRHLRHVGEIQRLLDSAGLVWQRFVPGPLPDVHPPVQVWLIETMGLLVDAYRQADVAFVGGSLVPVGGHNLYEPAALGCAVITGPHTDQQHEAKTQLQAQGALIEVTSSAALAEALIMLGGEQSPLEQMGQAGRGVVRQQSKSLDRTWAVVETLLVGAPEPR